MSNLSFVTDLAANLSTVSVPMAMMFVTMVMVLPGVVVGAYSTAYNQYKSMSSEDKDMLVGMSVISLGLGLFAMFAMTNMNVIVLMTLAGLAVKEWSSWAADINEQDEQQILVGNYIAFENTLALVEWRAQVTRTNREILAYAAPARKLVVRQVAPLVNILDQMDAIYNNANNSSIGSSQVLMAMRMMKK